VASLYNDSLIARIETPEQHSEFLANATEVRRRWC
jgi:hypothetical protein